MFSPILLLLAGACTGMVMDPGASAEGPGDAADGGSGGGPVERMPGVVDPGETLARRLTRDEYLHTVRDLLGVTLPEADAALLPRETSTEGFTNTAVGLVVTADHAEAYFAVAERVVSMLDLPAFLDAHAPCRELSRECTEGFARSAGELLFRRPLDDREAASFAALFDAGAAEGLGFDEGATLVLEAFLQAPQFLYRLETQRTGDSGVREVDGHELAVRLSYLLWSSAPDATLLAAADDGSLGTPDGLHAQVDRMLADPRARRASERFIRDWMGLDALSGISRADLDGALAEDLADSTARYWQALIWEDGAPLEDALDSQTAWLTPEMASWYGVGSAGEGLVRYDISGVQERVGLLTQPAVLTVMADRDVGGIVARGLFVMERLLCSEPLSPPPDLDLSAFRSHLGPEATEREYSEDRLANEACAGCHTQFDPFAYAFERFDGIGRYRLESEHGRPLREDGEIIDESGGTSSFDTVAEYAALLATDGRVQRCLTEKHVQFAVGRAMEHEDGDWVGEIHERYLSAGGTYEAMVRAIVAHPLFRTIRTEE